jgi:hypothetical protein
MAGRASRKPEPIRKAILVKEAHFYGDIIVTEADEQLYVSPDALCSTYKSILQFRSDFSIGSLVIVEKHSSRDIWFPVHTQGE